MANLDELEKSDISHGGEHERSKAAQARLRRLTAPEDDSPETQEYARLLELYDNSFRSIAEGEVVKGTVLRVTPSEVVVDVGFKSEGMIPISEFHDENGQVTVAAGDIVDVLLERTEDRDGHVEVLPALG